MTNQITALESFSRPDEWIERCSMLDIIKGNGGAR
jgi:hypothetical protein